MNEHDFAQKMKPWLERSAQGVGELEATRLKAARLRAVEAWREPVNLFGLRLGASIVQTLRYSMLRRALLVVPIVALVAMLALQGGAEPDLGELDAELLTQELPPDAFLDQDLRSWLGKSHG